MPKITLNRAISLFFLDVAPTFFDFYRTFNLWQFVCKVLKSWHNYYFFYLRFNLITPNHLCEVDIIILIFLYELYILVPYGRQIYGISYRQLLQYSYIQYIFVRWKCISNTFIDIVHETKYKLTVLMATRGGIWRFHYL